MSAYRFMLRPRWILSHVLIAALVILMINLGFWQLRRLDEKKSFNRNVAERQAQPVAPVGEVIPPTAGLAAGDGVSFRKATATGRFDLANEVIIRSRSMNGFAGVWVMTPLVTADGDAVMVMRGFHADQGIPKSLPAASNPPTGTVTVTGFLQPTQTKGFLGATDPPEGHLFDLARADLDRMQKQVPYHLYPVYLQLSDPLAGATDASPQLVPVPVLDEGPHFSYAVQWFLFSTIAVIGYPIILRRRARELAAEARLDQQAAAGAGGGSGDADDIAAPSRGDTGAVPGEAHR